MESIKPMYVNFQFKLRLFIVSCLLISCHSRSSISIKTIQRLSSERDTLLQCDYNKRHYVLLHEIFDGTFGRFSMRLAVVEIDKEGVSKMVAVDGFGDALIDARDTLYNANPSDSRLRFGWFKTDASDGHLGELPGMRSIIDSLKRSLGMSVVDENGDIMTFKNGNHKYKEWNYGDFVLKTPIGNMDTLPLGLYILVDSSLKRISDRPEDLLRQEDGVYFIPQPGFGVTKAIALKDLLERVATYK